MQKIEDFVNNLKRKINVNKTEVIFVCIGTNKVVGDSIGPLVGSYLKQNIDNTKVFGDLENNICCDRDLIVHYPKIRDKFVVAIDSALGSKNLAGEIFVTSKPITMGLGINKNKGIVGNVSIKASICDLENIDKKFVNKLAKKVANGIYFWYNNK